MSGLWDSPGTPHKGWVCVDVIDLEPADENEYSTCEMCGKEHIRYVHIMVHDDHAGLDVGCVCAEKMTGDYINPKKQEQRLRNRAARKTKWLKRKWRTSAKGNSFINAEGHNLIVFPNKFHASKWSFGIDGIFSNRKFDSEAEAKLAMFDEFWKLLQADEEREEANESSYLNYHTG